MYFNLRRSGIKNMPKMNPERSFKASIYFDLSTEALKTIYASQTNHDYTNAYNKIRSFMEENSYKHEQGSVYHSTEELTNPDIYHLMKDMSEKFPWLKDCTERFSYAEISERHDLMHLLQNEKEMEFDFNMELDPPDGREVLEQLVKNGKGRTPGMQKGHTQTMDFGR